jgi:hypothetical protein
MSHVSTPAHRAANQPADRPASLPTSRPLTQPASQPPARPACQPAACQPTNHPACQPATDKPASQPVPSPARPQSHLPHPCRSSNACPPNSSKRPTSHRQYLLMTRPIPRQRRTFPRLPRQPTVQPAGQPAGQPASVQHLHARGPAPRRPNHHRRSGPNDPSSRPPQQS